MWRTWFVDFVARFHKMNFFDMISPHMPRSVQTRAIPHFGCTVQRSTHSIHGNDSRGRSGFSKDKSRRGYDTISLNTLLSSRTFDLYLCSSAKRMLSIRHKRVCVRVLIWSDFLAVMSEWYEWHSCNERYNWNMKLWNNWNSRASRSNTTYTTRTVSNMRVFLVEF